MTIELTLGNAILITALFVSAMWALVKQLLDKQERRAVEREKRFTDRVDTADKDIDELQKEHAALRERVTRVEAQTQKMPGHEDLAALYERVNEIAGTVNNLAGEFKGVQRGVEMLHQYLLTGGKP